MDLVPCLMGLARGSRSTPNSEAALALEAEVMKKP